MGHVQLCGCAALKACEVLTHDQLHHTTVRHYQVLQGSLAELQPAAVAVTASGSERGHSTVANDLQHGERCRLDWVT
jgi:hypothetical protein